MIGNIASLTLVVLLTLPIFLSVMVIFLDLIYHVMKCCKTFSSKKKALEYLKFIFIWFTIPYNGWKVINGDKDIEVEHWTIKVINFLNCKNCNHYSKIMNFYHMLLLGHKKAIKRYLVIFPFFFFSK